MDVTPRDKVRDGMPAGGSEAASLVESAMLLRWRAPELALLLADRAAAAAGEDRVTVLRADHLAVFALNRLERHAQAVHRLLPAIRDADTPTELRNELQVELAHCAVGLGEPATALAAVRPVLAAGEDVAPVLRGAALVVVAESVEFSGALGRGDVVSCALEEADELFREDQHLDRDTALLLRATAKAVNAVRHRRSDAAAEAETQARAGCELLTGLADPEHDSGQVSGRLMLEIVLALLDRGEGEAAAREARPMLRRPVRAAGAGVVGWLRLALATRVHLAEGRHEPALALLADAVEVTQRHGVDAVLAECLEGLSQVHEVRGEFADALHCLRSARAAEARHRRTAERARSALLEHVGADRPDAVGLVDQIAALLPDTGWQRGAADPDTGPPDAQAYDCRDDAAPDASAALRQVLIAAGSAADEPVGQGLLAELSERLRDEVPEGSTLGKIMAERIAMLLPATSRTQAQASADLFRTESAPKLDAEISVGVVQPAAGTGPAAEVTPEEPAADEVVEEPAAVVAEPAADEIAVAEPAAVEEEPAADQVVGEKPAADQVVEEELAADVVQPAVDADTEHAVPQSTPEDSAAPATRRRRGINGTPVLVSELLPFSVLSAGRSGRRRAEDRAEGASTVDGAPAVEPALSAPSSVTVERGEAAPPEDTVTESQEAATEPEEPEEAVSEQAPPDAPDPGPPLAPAPRALEWGSNGTQEGESLQVGLGDLLAEALAAFQEGHPPLIEGSAMTTLGGNTVDSTPHRGLVGRRVYGLQLARDPMDRNPNNVAEALTDPELRLPDLTAEPPWRPDGTGRQSAVGD
ncbi:MAG: hypothetical protein ACT4NY_18200 [Pseudonocardiales bacterium]